ncbi:hypothetical protein CIK06_27450 [Plantactinospora sp. KBS50]|nr:hypothetical protein [Plantactinospora sp. KBS50]ASW58062.1 hypothetical protein CIK06_27450 [Plantactinospora sp. KBS50]
MGQPTWPGRPAAAPRSPSGLFPSGPGLPSRPTYREPHPVRGGAVALGIVVTIAWLLCFGLLGRSLAGYVWWTVLGGGIAWLVAALLTRYGDRGAAAGIAMATSLGWSVAAVVVAVRWGGSGDWPLW